jgi:hypothetical protein
MSEYEKLHKGDRKLYSEGYFSGDFNQDVYIKKSVDDGSHKDKYYLELYSNINGIYTLQGYVYFYLNKENKTSYFIGVKVIEEYRNLNMGSLLISLWLEFCLNNGFEYLGVNHKQRKPFLLYMLKTYAFDVFDLNLYNTRNDVISICRSIDFDDNTKYLMFKDEHHQKNFMQTNIFRSDNYKIVDDLIEQYEIGKVILPLQNITRNPVDYYLKDKEYASYRACRILQKHHK